MHGLTSLDVRRFPCLFWWDTPSRRCDNHTFIMVDRDDRAPSIGAGIFILVLVAWFICSPTVAWPQAHQPRHEIRQAAAEFLQQTVAKNGNMEHVQIGQIDSRLRLPLCGTPLVTFLPPGVTPKGNITVGIRCSGPKPWKLYVSARVVTYQHVVVLTRSLPRHSTITEDDVRLKRHNTTLVTSPLLTEVAEAIGKELTQTLPAERPLTYSVLKNPVIIRRGQRVTLLYQSPGIEVRGSGTAMADGGKGERISAKPLGTLRAIAGVVLQPGVILVNQR